MPAHNSPVASNTGRLRIPALKLPAGARGQEKRQQVNPALRLPAERYSQFFNDMIINFQLNL